MQGKILGAGFINGDDGKRYHFGDNDIKNLEGRDINKLSGVKVDFEVADENGQKIAKDIFIIGGGQL